MNPQSEWAGTQGHTSYKAFGKPCRDPTGILETTLLSLSPFSFSISQHSCTAAGETTSVSEAVRVLH